MATIFYNASGSFSALTPQKVVSSYLTPASDSYDAADTARYVAFTPSEAGDVHGVFVGLWITSTTAANSVTVNLQTNSGGWVDVAGATKTLYHTNADLYGSFGPSRDQNGTLRATGGNMMWTYFEFATPATVDVTPDKWRIKVQSNNNTTRLLKNGANYAHAVVLTATTAYTSGDTALFRNFETFGIDQSITLAAAVTGTQTKFDWQAPAASYTLTITTLYQSYNFQFYVGSAGSPIPYAQQAIINITNWNGGAYWTAPQGYEYVLYGEKPTSAFAYLSANAAASQANIVTTVDLSAVWTVGDTVHVTGGEGGNVWESKTISSMSGTTVTLNSNLASIHYSDYAVVNVTRFEKMGIKLKIGNPAMTAKLKLSGVLMDSALAITANSSMPDYSRIEPYVFDTIYFPSGLGVSIFNSSNDNSVFRTAYSGGRDGTVLKDIYFPVSTSYVTFSLYFNPGQSCIIDNVIFATNQTYGWVVWRLYDSTITNFQGCGASEPAYRMCSWSIDGSVINDCLFLGRNVDSGLVSLNGNANTFNRSKFDLATIAIPSVTGLGNVFNDCEFGQKRTVTSTIGQNANLYQVLFRNCKGSIVAENDSLSLAGAASRVLVEKNNQSPGDHKSWWKYGKLQSTGDGLTDTTVRTAGTGKFALRFEPTSSANNLEWSSSVPTGNLQGQAVTIEVWCKINSATFYAGTHQKPRLTVDYDHGTVVYAEAVASTDWQLVSVTFTPATSYGTVTVTLSGRTDATVASAYVYFDDFSVVYPAGYSLDLGGMDLWADALPASPLVTIGGSSVIVIED